MAGEGGNEDYEGEGEIGTADIVIIVVYFIFVIIVGLWASIIIFVFNASPTLYHGPIHP